MKTQEIIDKIESRLLLAESARNPAHRQEFLALANAYSAYLLARNTCSVAEPVEEKPERAEPPLDPEPYVDDKRYPHNDGPAGRVFRPRDGYSQNIEDYI